MRSETVQSATINNNLTRTHCDTMNRNHFTGFILVLIVLAGCLGNRSHLAASDPSESDTSWAPQKYGEKMMDPSKANETAPETFKVKFETTKGDFVVQVNRKWSPNGADRFYNLVKIGYFDDVVFFRCIEGFMNQFGIHGDPIINDAWADATIKDDPRVKGVSNQKGYLTFARTGAPNSRSVQFFINAGDNARLDTMGFTPIGKIVQGMDNFLKLNTQYGENQPQDQEQFQKKGNDYILGKYPKLDRILHATLVE